MHSRLGSMHGHLKLLILLFAYTAVCCLSLHYVRNYTSAGQIYRFDGAKGYPAFVNVAPMIAAALLLAFGRFSFGYVLSFGFYTMVLGYLWLAKFSMLQYDHLLGSVSAFASLLAFQIPALLVSPATITQHIALSRTSFDRLLLLMLAFSAAVILIGALYSFRIVSLAHIYDFRGQLRFPGPLRYAISIVADALLPFAFASFLALKDRWRAGAVLLLLLLLYPVTLTKSTLFGPSWLVFLALLTSRFEAKTATILSLFLPMALGTILLTIGLYGMISYGHYIAYFEPVNFRMIAIPSIAMDVYGDFFSKHELTHFCQVTLLNRFLSCPSESPNFLAMEMLKTYPFGYVNASLFATEGIASVGPKLAPLVVLACGLVVSLGNYFSSGLPNRFILVSSGMLLPVFLNVPFTTSLLSHGVIVLFLLWYVLPRSMFQDAERTYEVVDR